MTAKTAGRSTRAWKKLRAQKRAEAQARFDAGEEVICWLCRFPIDMTLPEGDKLCWSPDHLYPVSTHPELAEDPANIRDSHQDCNDRRGNKTPTDDLGVLSICPQSETGRWVKAIGR